MSLNRRVHPRSLTDVRATVELAEDISLACVIRDRSDGGARLVFVQACGLPPTFRLRVLQQVSNAELIWSDGRQAGVRLSPAAVQGRPS